MNKSSVLKRTVLAVLSCFAISVEAQTLTTLKEMIEKVISQNPEVQAKYHEYTAAGYERDVVHGGYLPKADVVSTYRKQEDMDDGISRRNGTAIPRFNNELVLRQMILLNDSANGFAKFMVIEGGLPWCIFDFHAIIAAGADM